jgi:phosphatidylserine decarboxylase
MVLAILAAGGYVFWRQFWFFRDPQRMPPPGVGLVSPADGTVVYVRKVEPGADVVVIKQGVAAKVSDILREDFDKPKLVVGIFMSPFDVHYNRAPLGGTVKFIHRYPARGGGNHFMGEMHLRSVLGLGPRYAGSMHIVENERAVTQIEGEYKGAPLACYVVQIGARTVNGIDSFVPAGGRVERGATFGMIRVGSQVDVVIPWRYDFSVLVKEGDRVVAGETLLVR